MSSNTPETTDDSNRSRGTAATRRSVLTGAAALGGTALFAGSANAGLTQLLDPATETGSIEERLQALKATQRQQQAQQQQEQNPDIDVLNYALTLEHLEYTFYREGLKEFADDELMEANVLDAFGETIRMEVPKYLADIRDNEEAHVDAITKTIEKLGGDPVPEGEYAFGYKTPSEFLKIGKALENTGVTAYKGAAPAIVNNKVLKAALAIHSVEARHASFLNLVNMAPPFPRAFDRARTVEEVLEIAGPFIKKQPGLDKKAITELDDPNDPKPDRKADDKTSDLEVLNYALTLEHLEYAFYRDGLETFSDCELENAVACRFGEEVTMNVPKLLAEVRDNEEAHVDAITKTVKKLGGDPVREAEYDFGYNNATQFLKVAMALENTGVSAYLGAAPTISNDKVFKAAAAIQSVEARHASYFNELNGKVPFPRAFDEAKSMQEVKQIASQFIVST
jgi:rubrerythrin